MVRLIVGACMQAGMGQISVESVRKALEQQIPLEKSLSVPAEGLFLSDIRYPYPF
jgi:tRNA pseudouridine38-40 synthase